MTLVVNFFGGPGTGKSTTTAGAFAHLKLGGHNVEIAHEFAKDLTWEGRKTALNCQPYIIGKQIYRVQRLIGQVDAILTDSPILLGMVYRKLNVPDSFDRFILDQFNTWDTLNIFLKRDLAYHPYNPKGRNQDITEALAIDDLLLGMLKEHNIPFETVPVASDTAEYCTDLIEAYLDGSE